MTEDNVVYEVCILYFIESCVYKSGQFNVVHVLILARNQIIPLSVEYR